FIGRSNVLTGTVVATQGDNIRVRVADGTVFTAPRVANTASDLVSVDDDVAVSLRPEAITLTIAPPVRQPDQLEGRVLTAEFTGAVNIYEIDWLGQTLVVSVPDSFDRAVPGDLVTMVPTHGLVWMVQA
ncbi:hypothetical protein JF66_19515, partial [Cryobacterium sp. MLB-32]|uniref:TOBE domain-containing protein n=1 Tax=Cryobacterium sp. MLB-32 TaxID=1529318 RepID=UPI0004E76143